MSLKYLILFIQASLLIGTYGAGGFFWGGSGNKKGLGSPSSEEKNQNNERNPKKSDVKASTSYSSMDSQKGSYGERKSKGSKVPSITDVDDSNLYISEVLY